MSLAILAGRYWNMKELDEECFQVDQVGEELQRQSRH